ncbi:MAG: oligosaccharide flippase family protein [Chloroflexota bacterium]
MVNPNSTDKVLHINTTSDAKTIPDGDMVEGGTKPDVNKVDPPKRGGRRVLLNTGAMAGSSLWRILVSFLLQALVTRQLGFAALGQYTVALAYLNVSQIIAEMGLQGLLVRELAQNRGHRRQYFMLALWLQIGAGFLIWLGLWWLTKLLPYSDTMANLLWLIGGTLPFYAVTVACQMLFQGCERMELVMFVELIINSLIGLLSILVLFMDGTVVDLVLILIVTQALSAGFCILLVWYFQLLTHPDQTTPSQPDKAVAPSVLLKRALPFYGLSLADVLLQRLDIILLSAIGGDVLTGIYSAAYNVVRVFLKLIQSFWKGLYPTLSRLFQQTPQRYNQLCQMSLQYGLLLLFLVAPVGAGLATVLLNLLYKSPSAESVAAFEILIWVIPLFLVELYAITLMMVENRTGYSLLLMIVHLLAVALLLPIFTSLGQAFGTALAVLLASMIGTVASLVMLQHFKMPRVPSGTYLILLPASVAAIAITYLPAPLPLQISSGIGIYLVLLPLCGIYTCRNLKALRDMMFRPG